MNKGLEVIEAHELFGAPYDRDRGGGPPAVGRALDGRVHRRLDDRPAQHARHAPADRLRPGLSRPHRHARSAASTGRRCAGSTSSRPTARRSGASTSPTQAGRAGGTAPAWLSAANEVAVEAFLAGHIALESRSPTCALRCSTRHDGATPDTVDDVIEADAQAGGSHRQLIDTDGSTDDRPTDPTDRPAADQPTAFAPPSRSDRVTSEVMAGGSVTETERRRAGRWLDRAARRWLRSWRLFVWLGVRQHLDASCSSSACSSRSSSTNSATSSPPGGRA